MIETFVGVKHFPVICLRRANTASPHNLELFIFDHKTEKGIYHQWDLSLLHIILHTNFIPREIPYLFELRHLMPRLNFEGMPLFKKSKDQCIFRDSKVETCHVLYSYVMLLQAICVFHFHNNSY